MGSIGVVPYLAYVSMDRGDSLAELPRVFARQGSALGLAQESRESEGGISEASSHVDQLISAFEHISTQQPKIIASDAGNVNLALCQSNPLLTMHAESTSILLVMLKLAERVSVAPHDRQTSCCLL